MLIIVLQLNTFVGGPPVAHDDYTVTTGYVLMIDNLRSQRRLPFLFMEGFGFRMRKHDFLDKKEMLQELTHTAQRDFSGDDCFWCVIRSDGTKDGICGTDDEVVKPETITSLFSSNKCRTLEGKPEIFVIEKKNRQARSLTVVYLNVQSFQKIIFLFGTVLFQIAMLGSATLLLLQDCWSY